MRNNRTRAEKLILNRISSQLVEYGIDDYRVDEFITDKPDILINHKNGKLGIEVTRIDYEEYCKWSNTPPEPPYTRACEVTVNLRKMLASVMKKKKKKYQEYKILRSLNECWLVLHNDVFDFKDTVPETGRPDRNWFEEFSCYELQDLSCPFDRVLFNLEQRDIWYSLYNKHSYKQRRRFCTGWPSIIIKEAGLQLLEAKVYNLNFSDNVPKQQFE